MGILWQAWRSWSGAKGVALLAIVAFMVGIGSATAIFTVINSVLLRPLPYPDGERFVALYGASPNEPGRYSSSTITDLIEYERRTTSFDVFGWFRVDDFNLTFSGEPQFVSGVMVTPSLAHSLGVPPAIGLWFTDDTGIVLSNRLWRRLDGDPNVVGTTLDVDERQLTVTGVMPASFRFPVLGTTPGLVDADIWLYLDPTGRAQNPTQGIHFGYARRKPGVSLEQARADAKRVAAEIARLDPVSHPSYSAEVVGLREDTFSNLSSTLLLLFAAAGLLLLIACANVATLLLTRSVSKARETAIRIAIGAARGHLAVRYFAEGALVSLLGSAAGVGLAVLLVRGITTVGAGYLPASDEMAIDWKVLAFAVGVALVASALASVAPLWQALRTPPNAVLTDGVRVSASARARRVAHGLVVAELALAFTLLAASAILVAHFRNLTRVPTGFNPEGVLTFEITAPQSVVRSPNLAAYQSRLIDAVESIPRVASVAVTNQLPLDGCCLGGTVYPEGRSATRDVRRVAFLVVSPKFTSAMGIPMQAGRFLTDADPVPRTDDDPVLAVINQAAADRYWPNRDAIGAYGRLNQPNGNRFQVVGIVGNVRNDGLNKLPEAELYLPARLAPSNPMTFVVRSSLSSTQLVPAIRRAVQSVDRSVAIHDVQLMSDIVRESLQLERVSSLVMAFFAAAALVMATLGIYGVVSYSVRQRTVEMGTRMALGAVRRNLFALIVGGGVKLAAAGIAVGAIALAVGVWLLVRFLEVRDIGWLPVASSIAVVGFVAAAASYVPALRATLLSPMVAIRDETASGWQAAREQIARAVKDVREAVSSTAPPPLLPLSTELAAVARSADSFDDALSRALALVCDRLECDAAVILEKEPDAVYRRRAAIGAFESIEWWVPGEGFLRNRLTMYPLPLPFEVDEWSSLADWAAANRPARLDEIRALSAAGVRIAVALRTRHEITGIMLLGPMRSRQPYGSRERQFLGTCADQFALMMENARLTDRVVEQEVLRRDLALASEVQKRLLPDAPPSAEIAEFAAISVPARSIGGDYYDFIQVDDRRIGIALADVSGKGVAAALIMSVVQASLRLIASDGDISLPRLAAKMNDFLYRTTPGNKYATFFYAQVEGQARQLRYVNAGHNPPYLVRAGGSAAEESREGAEILELTTGGAVVGMLPGLSYEEATLDLHAGDVLLAYTDGVTEAHNPQSEEFGEERLKAVLREVADLSADDIRARISAELQNWIQDAEQYDDLTFVVMKVR